MAIQGYAERMRIGIKEIQNSGDRNSTKSDRHFIIDVVCWTEKGVRTIYLDTGVA